MKGAGLQDTRENCWKFFIDRVRKQLKVNCSYNIIVGKNDLSLVLHCIQGNGHLATC